MRIQRNSNSTSYTEVESITQVGEEGEKVEINTQDEKVGEKRKLENIFADRMKDFKRMRFNSNPTHIHKRPTGNLIFSHVVTKFPSRINFSFPERDFNSKIKNFFKQPDAATNFISNVANAISKDAYSHLLDEIRIYAEPENITNKEIAYHLVNIQFQKIKNVLKEPELIENFFSQIEDTMTGEFFVKTEQWLMDFNLICMCLHLNDKHYRKEKAAATNAMNQINKGNFNIDLYVKEIAAEFAGDSREVLDLNSAGLTNLPHFIDWFLDVANLKLSSNSLQFPEKIESFVKLKKLDLSKNSIHPKWHLQLSDGTKNKSINVLNLSKNNLNRLPDILSQLEKLTTLILSHNKIVLTSDSMSNLIAIKKLDLHSNELTDIPEEIECSKRLLELNLKNNKLNKLPDSLSKLSYLRSLNLANNAFEEIPQCIFELPNLRFLDISENPLKNIPYELFYKCPKLESLKISPSQQKLLPNGEPSDKVKIYLNTAFNHFALSSSDNSASIDEVTDDMEDEQDI